MKKFLKTYALLKKHVPSWKHAFISSSALLVLLLSFTMKKSVADNGDRAAKGALFGGILGAGIGGAAGGGKGAGIGAVTGLGLGALIGGTTGNGSSRDPYRQLEREQNRLNKLQNRLARTRAGSPRYQRLAQEVDNQARIVQDLQMRLQAGTGYQQPRYQPAGYQQQPAGYGRAY